jgi:predicted nuclease with TOPRIM domain
MSLFSKKTDPFSEELKRLETESRQLEEKMRRLEASLDTPISSIPLNTQGKDHFKGATFRDDEDIAPPPRFTTKRALKIQKRKLRNRVIVLGAILFLLLLVLLRVLN